MDLSFPQLFLALALSVVGYAYYRYGRKRPAPAFLVAGLIMMVFAYFVKPLWLAALIAAVLAAAPFLIRTE